VRETVVHVLICSDLLPVVLAVLLGPPVQDLRDLQHPILREQVAPHSEVGLLPTRGISYCVTDFWHVRILATGS